jgi:prepilin-type N-terminal cleavage/methylation domain-containing protein
MKSRKGFTLVELLVLLAIIVIFALIGGVVIGGCCLIVKGVAAGVDAQVAHEQRLETNPPLFAVGDIVYHKASEKKMIVSKRYITWNDKKRGWNIMVKDGGLSDAVGGFLINETEVLSDLEEEDSSPE